MTIEQNNGQIACMYHSQIECLRKYIFKFTFVNVMIHLYRSYLQYFTFFFLQCTEVNLNIKQPTIS
jgi:hypothetical protein